MIMNILVTGGAGYIGSSTVSSLIGRGHNVLVIDNLSTGKKEFVDKKATFYELDLINKEQLEFFFSKNKIEAVIHLAAYKSVEESMIDPEKYSDNIIGTINLMNVMYQFGVKKIIFSSSAAVYGNPHYLPIDEKHQLHPLNYYSFTKLECEKIINWFSKFKEITGVNLRYFNVAGDSGLGYINEAGSDIFSILMGVVSGKRDKFVVFGNDYKTRDGTCIRDYIDLNDIISAHILALKLTNSETINLGTSNGTSVLELVKYVKDISKKEIKIKISGRREGDSPISVSSFNKAKKLLGWVPKHDVKEMIKSEIKVYSK